jgi:hypothetical protein
MFILKHQDEPIILSIIKLMFVCLYFIALYLMICICIKYSNAENLRLINLRRNIKIYFNSPKPKYSLISINENNI